MQMQVVRRYEIKLFQENEIEMPAGAQILHINGHATGTFLWALVDENKPAEKRKIGVFESDQDFTEHHKTYIGTFFMPGTVFHAFELYNAMDPFAKK